jgi:hypothetical protein
LDKSWRNFLLLSSMMTPFVNNIGSTWTDSSRIIPWAKQMFPPLRKQLGTPTSHQLTPPFGISPPPPTFSMSMMGYTLISLILSKWSRLQQPVLRPFLSSWVHQHYTSNGAPYPLIRMRKWSLAPSTAFWGTT